MEQQDTLSEMAYSLSLACKDYTYFGHLLPKPSALMQSQLRVSQGQLNHDVTRQLQQVKGV